MEKGGHIFYSKILLFGEYSVIFNSMGLSIPYSHFRGELEFIESDRYTDLNFAQESNYLLRSFADHLKKLLLNKNLPFGFKIYELLKDIEQGLFSIQPFLRVLVWAVRELLWRLFTIVMLMTS